MDFAGEVYDGPLEGQWITKSGPRFSTVIHDGLPRSTDPEKFFRTHLHFYRWSRPLHKWVSCP